MARPRGWLPVADANDPLAKKPGSRPDGIIAEHTCAWPIANFLSLLEFAMHRARDTDCPALVVQLRLIGMLLADPAFAAAPWTLEHAFES